MVGPFREIGEVLVGQVDEPLAHVLLRQLDEEAADRVADAARAGMEHHPHRIRFVEAELDEVVAAAQRAQLPVQLVDADTAVLGLDRVDGDAATVEAFA